METNHVRTQADHEADERALYLMDGDATVDGIGLDVSAPHLIAGITVWSPLTRWGSGPGKQVAPLGDVTAK